MSNSAAASDVSSSSGEEEEEEMTPPSKKPAITEAVPPRKPLTAAAKSPSSKPRSKSLARIPAPQPSNPESSEDDDDDSGEESTDADSDSDDSVPNSQNPPPKPLAAAAATVTKPSDSDDSGSETESSDQHPEIRHSARVADPSIKPLASKPMDEPAHPRKAASHKKLLMSPAASLEPEGKRQPLQRVWSKDDELVLLNGLVDYKEKKGSVPTTAVMDDFHESIQKSLSIDVSNTQLSDKIRRLKVKYLAAVAQGKIKTAPSSSKSLDQDVSELANQIWGRGRKSVKSENGNADGYAEDEVTRKWKKAKDEHDSLDSIPEEASDHDNPSVAKYSYPLLRELVLKTGTKQTASIAGEAVEMVDVAKAEEIVGRYNKLALLEMKNNLRRMALMQESVKLFMEAVEKLV